MKYVQQDQIRRIFLVFFAVSGIAAITTIGVVAAAWIIKNDFRSEQQLSLSVRLL